MSPERRPVIYRLAKFSFKLALPALNKAKNLQDKYRRAITANSYNFWANNRRDYCYVKPELKYQPLVSIVVPAFNTPKRYLREMVYSVVNQHYANWELILVNASDNAASRQQVADCAEIDGRIKVVDVQKNRGISVNTNAGLAQAKGEYIALLDHDDLLHCCALHSVIEALQITPRADVIYTDEDKVSASSERFLLPHFKAGWSPDTLRNLNYITHLVVVKRNLVKKIKGLRPATDGAQDYDLLLRLTDEGAKFWHVPRVLYHWRMAEGSTADLVANKNYILKAGVKALNDHVARNNLPAEAQVIEGKPGYYKLVYKPVAFSLIVGPVAADRQAACAAWLEELLGPSQNHQVQLIIGDWFKNFQSAADLNLAVSLVDGTDEFLPTAAAAIKHDKVAWFTAAARPIGNHGLNELVAATQGPGEPILAPILVNDKNLIIGPAITKPKQNLSKKLFEGYTLGTYTWFGDTDWVRDVYDLTVDVLAMKAAQFKMMANNSDNDRGTARSLMPNQTNLVLWAHTPFKYLGQLNPSNESSYQEIQPFRFMPQTVVHIDDWYRKYERANE